MASPVVTIVKEPKQEAVMCEQLLDDNFIVHKNGAVELTPPDVWKDSKLPKWLQVGITELFSFVTIHYNLWLAPFVFLFYYLVQNGYTLVVVALTVIYMSSFLDGSESTGDGRAWDLFRTAQIWNAALRVLNMKCIREAPLDSSKRYIFGFQPHGIIILSRAVSYGGMWETLFPNITYRILGASSVYRVPLARELCLWLGGVDASRSTAEKVLKAGHSIMVYPGGVPEIFLVDPKSKVNELFLKKRFGFIKLAMRNDADLVPVFVFGEKWLYNVWSPSKKVIAFVRKTLHIPLIVFWGRFLWLPITPPKTRSFGVVYGKPLAVKHSENPTDEEVQAVQAEYMKEVERLFHQYKADFGYDEDETLVIT